jgi:hypothetical protein
MKVVGDISLFASTDCEMPEQRFQDQLLDIQPEARSARITKDGRLVVTSHPRNITWHGGRAAFLQDVAHVRIVCAGGTVVDDDLTPDKPRSIAEGISFEVRAAEIE